MKKKMNNKGVTLVELIVVIAIIAILGTAGAASFGMVTSRKADKFVTELDAILSQCKINTLAGAEEKTYVELSVEDGVYTAKLYEGDSRLIASKELGKDMEVQLFTRSNPYSGERIDENFCAKVCFGFERGTGVFRELGQLNSDWDGDYATSIEVSYGTFHRKIVMVPETGYFYTE